MVNENDFYLVRIERAGSKACGQRGSFGIFFNENGFYLVYSLNGGLPGPAGPCPWVPFGSAPLREVA
jgi:hypothetical protein